MSPDPTQKLLARHPALLIVPPKSVIAARGIECGDGWFELITETLSAIESHCANVGSTLPQITQIKEKFGKLRIYFTPWDDGIGSLLDAAEHKSATICERCGRPGKLVGQPFPHSTCGNHL